MKVQARIIPTPSKWAKVDEKTETGDAQVGENPSNDEVFCCLTAFTASSVEVQEGDVGSGKSEGLPRWKPLVLYTRQ